MQEEIERETGKKLTAQDIINLMQEDLRGLGSDLEKVLSYLETLVNEDSETTARPVLDEESKTIKGIFFTDGHMQEKFNLSPEILQIDVTYKLDKEDYRLITFCVVDGFEIVRLCAWAVIHNEKKDLLLTVLETFKDTMSPDDIAKLLYIIVDKDFNEITCLLLVFPHAIFVICRWHAEKAVTERKQKIRTYTTAQANAKEEVLKKFKLMLYEKEETDYNSAYRELLELGQLHTELREFTTYITQNWHCHRANWAQHKLKHDKLRSNFTNNRTEALNGVIKRVIGKKQSLEKVVQRLFLPIQT